MWNALAGYGGLVSVGQQAFIGLGAYGTICFVKHGVTPYLAMVLATRWPRACSRSRSRSSCCACAAVSSRSERGWSPRCSRSWSCSTTTLGGGTGTSLTGLNIYSPEATASAYTYWLTLAFAAALLVMVFLLLRSRLGASLQAIRDDEEAAASLGVRVDPAKRILFVVAGVGCGAAGALTLANTLFIAPQ